MEQIKRNKVQEIAKEAVRLNRIKEIQLAFEEIIKKNEAILRKLTDNSEKEQYEKLIKIQKANLNYFNQTTENLLQQKNENNLSANTTKEQFVEAMKKIMEKIYQRDKNMIFNFVAEPNEYYRELEEYIKSVTNIGAADKVLIKSQLLNENTSKLMNYFGKESFEFYSIYCNKLNQKIEKLSQENVGTKDFSEAFESLMELIEDMQKASSNGIDVSYDKNSLTVSISFPYNIIKKVNKRIVSNKTQDLSNQNTLTDDEIKEKELASFREQAEAILAVYYEEYEKTIQTLINTLDREALNKQLGDLFVDETQFPHLSKEEKTKTINEIGSKYEKEKNDKYGRGFIEYLQNIIIKNLSEIPFEELQNSVFGTEEFERKYDKVYDGLKKLVDATDDNKLTPNFIKILSFDDKTQKFSIEFVNKNVPKYEIQILSDKALTAMKNETTPLNSEIDLSNLGEEEVSLLTKSVNVADFASDFFDNDSVVKNENDVNEDKAAPKPSTITEPESLLTSIENIISEPAISEPISKTNTVSMSPAKDAAVNDYLSKVEELNNTIGLINQLNQKLTANLIYDFLDLRNLENTISLENEAKELDQKIIALKLELSKDRIKFKQDFNEYIISIPQVKTSKIKDIFFNDSSLTSFVTLVDEQLAMAENKIVELDKERQVCTNTARINEINTQITTILTFIENQNSLIARRIVSESENKDFDIVAFLQTRRANKKEIRNRVKSAYENTNIRPIVLENLNEGIDEDIQIESFEGLVLPHSESTIPFAEQVEAPAKKVTRKTEPHYEIPTAEPVEPSENETIKEEPHYEIPSVEDIKSQKPKRKSRTKAKPETSAVPEPVALTPQPVEPLTQTEEPLAPTEEAVAPTEEKFDSIEETVDSIEYPEDDPRSQYALDDPMRYNKIPEVPEEKFDKMFETPEVNEEDELTPIDGEYLKELFLNTGDKNEKVNDEPVIPESSLEEPENTDNNEFKESSDQVGSEEILDDSDDDDFEYNASSQDFSNVTNAQLLEMLNDINGSDWDDIGDSNEDDYENSEELEEIGLTIPEEPIKTESLDEPVSEIAASEDPNETVQKLGHTIIEWTDSKGTIISDEFKGLYLSASNISEEAYNNALKELAELNVIEIGKFTIQAKMSEEEFDKVLSEYNIDRENETIPKQVTIELRILELNPLIKNQTVSRSRGLILEGDTITLSQMKNGLKVRYSEDLRHKLSNLNAKLRLIKKDNHRSKITVDISESNPEQLLAFKDGRNINHEDYIVDIRIPNSSEPLFEYDLADDQEEQKHTL